MEKLMQLLSDGRFHSGEELGRALGVSRAAVWKKIHAMEEMGLVLDAVRGRGYRLPPGIELLNREKILRNISPDRHSSLGIQLSLTTASTNNDVQKLADCVERWQVSIAEHQTSGRGRRGRGWQSPLGASLYYSMLWRVDNGLPAMDGLSLAVGLTVVKTLESLGVPGLGLKWPNDILSDNKKVSGVLLEISGDPTDCCEVAIGIGVNLVPAPGYLSKIDRPATDVRTIAGKVISKNGLAGRLTDQLITMLDTFQAHGFVPFKKNWEKYDALVGRSVQLHGGDNIITGIAAGISDNGAVLIRSDETITAYAGGEISLRAL